MKKEKYKVPLQKRHTVSWNVSMQHKLQLLSDGFKFTPIISNEMFNEKFEPKQTTKYQCNNTTDTDTDTFGSDSKKYQF